jgi:glycosyltransferase involved in cell wall biosynthesis
MKLARELIFVSSYMAEFYNKRYSFTVQQHIIPCLSDLSYNGSDKVKDSFCYTGGLSEWQKIDWMLKIFNEIVEVRHNATLHIATLDTKKFNSFAKQHLSNKAYSATNICSIDSRERMEDFLSKCEYGFLLRESCVVNYVSSPIKLAEYLACGVNVVMSSSIKSYSQTVASLKAGQVLSSPDDFNAQDLTFNLDNALLAYTNIAKISTMPKPGNIL